MFKTREMVKHFIHVNIPEMELDRYTVATTNYSGGAVGVFLEMNRGLARSTQEITLKNGGEDTLRGRSHDIILVDGFVHRSLGEHQQFIQHVLLPSICDKKGKIIMNVCA